MSDYKELKDTFQREKLRLKSNIDKIEPIINRTKRIMNIVSELNKEKDAGKTNLDKIVQLKRYFPELTDMFKDLAVFGRYKWILTSFSIENFNSNELIKASEKCQAKYMYPSEDMIDKLKEGTIVIDGLKNINPNHISISDGEFKTMISEKATILYEMGMVIDSTQTHLASAIMDIIKEKLKQEKSAEDLLKEIQDNREKLQLIDKFNLMFSNDKLLIKFKSEEEIESFTELIRTLFDISTCEEILRQISIDQNQEEKEIIVVTFDNLDISRFSDTEMKIIDEIREILAKEDLNNEDSLFSNQNISYSERIVKYYNSPINSVLLDVKNNLINKIYDDKDEVIRVFKVVVDLYKKYIVRNMREEQIKDFLRIRDDFNNIISFINKTYRDKSDAYKETKTINEYINSIQSEYIPILQELIDSDYNVDNFYDEEFKKKTEEYYKIIKEYKKKMTSYNAVDEKTYDNKENTDNLVFCLDEDIDLSSEGFQKEFSGTISELETKSSQELKKHPGRKGMARIRKTTDTGKEKDFIEYLEQKKRIKLHFIPYRYSSDSNYRTGLIKFEPSTKVKEFLEERYGLSKQSAYYGIFEVISVVRVDHSEYSYLEKYILDNYLEIEEIAQLFASDNPDYEKLTELIDEKLAIKKEKLRMYDSSSQK